MAIKGIIKTEQEVIKEYYALPNEKYISISLDYRTKTKNKTFKTHEKTKILTELMGYEYKGNGVYFKPNE